MESQLMLSKNKETVALIVNDIKMLNVEQCTVYVLRPY